MTNSDHQNQPHSKELRSYLVMTDSAFGASLEFREGFYQDFDGYSSVGWYSASSQGEAIEMAEKDFLSWGCSQECLEDISLTAFELASPKKEG